jgi:hypothetical protein
MTTYATNITTVANAVTTALATASSNAQTLRTNLAAGLPGTTLSGLASSTTSWKSDVGDMRIALDAAMQDLANANRQFVAIAAVLGAAGSLD